MTTRCTGPCQQGRLPCPSPQACLQPDSGADWTEAARCLARAAWSALRLDWPVARMYWLLARDCLRPLPF